jgi:hypothetical protein
MTLCELRTAQDIIDAAGQIPGLSELVVRHDFLGDLEPIFKALGPRIQTLILSWHDRPSNLPAALPWLTQLRTLDMRCCGMSKSAATLAKPMRTLTGLRSLDLRANGLCGKGAAVLVANLTGLRHLWLGFNEIKKEGAVFLAPFINQMTQLEELDLCDNGLEAQGAAIIVRQLPPGLKSLDLRNNEIGGAEDEFVQSLVHVKQALNLWT